MKEEETIKMIKMIRTTLLTQFFIDAKFDEENSKKLSKILEKINKLPSAKERMERIKILVERCKNNLYVKL